MVKSLKKIALVVSAGTILSKIIGMVRQLVIAGTFGVSAAYDAYNYAYIIPGFLLILLGGINGPFHAAMVSVLSKKTKREQKYIFTSINTLISSILLIITAIVIISADPLLKLLGPGLEPGIHKIAVIQLQIMAPIAFLAGLIGIGFGTLNATGEYFLPSISPLISSLAVIVGIGFFWFKSGFNLEPNQISLEGGIVLAISTLAGALLQWLIQLPKLIKKGFARISLAWDWKHSGVREVWKVLAPATLSSGMLQINVCTDLLFASSIVGAASALSYSSLLVQAPLGVVSNALLIPLLPTFSKLTHQSKRKELIKRIKQGLMLSSVSMVALASIFIVLSEPIITLIYERGAFDHKAVSLVSGLLIAYGIGMPTYLARDLLVRVFYALGDGNTPFKFSIIGIALNFIFDWILIGGPSPYGNQFNLNFGAAGLVLATGLVNLATCIGLLISLKLKLGKLPINEWLIDFLKILFSGLISGLIAFCLKTFIGWPSTSYGLLMSILISSSLSLFCFYYICHVLGIEEVSYSLTLIKKKFIRA